MQIQYVGRQPRHRERLYGTKVVFHGPGDIQEIEDESIAKKMLAKHPDQYGVPSDEAVTDEQQEELNDEDTGEEENTGDDGETESGQDPAEIETPADPQILIDGNYVPVAEATKDQLEAFARSEFEVELDKRKKKADLVAIVVDLIMAAQTGQE